MARRVLTAHLDGYSSLLSGSYGLRDLIETVTGRRPMYVPAARGFSVQERTARDVIALAQIERWDIVVTGPRMGVPEGGDAA